MTIFNDDDYDIPIMCIGACYQENKPFTHMYWARWALTLMREGFVLQTPAVYYNMDGDNKVIRRNIRKNTEHIYILTDEYDRHGRRLGVWPD